MSVSVTSMLTTIAYRFILGQFIPRLPYLTRLDIYSLICTLLVLLALFQVVLSRSLAANDDPKPALDLMRRCRWVFPAALLAAIVFTFVA